MKLNFTCKPTGIRISRHFSPECPFNAANGVSYRIEASTDLTEWNTVETDIIGQSAVVTRFYSTENMPRRYFRVRRN